MMKAPEIMAPVGSPESLAAALKAGADAVYFGLGRLNMRSRSRNNYTPDDLPDITARCREYGTKTYLALNTVLYDEDLDTMRSMVDAAARSGVSAVISSDPAVMNYVRSAGLPVHISTQCNITNIETVAFYSQWADVMVLARELNLDQVAEIHRQIQERDIRGPGGQRVRLEVFIHGALCMAVSGKCYLSLHTHNSSANRGACIQNCRRPYTVTDRHSDTELEIDNEYIMSASDLCTIGFLDKVLDAGVEVLKIEGRGRSADYVHTTVTCYREAVEAIRDGSWSPEKIRRWEEELATVYNRGFWDGYYLGRKMGEWSDVHGSKATVKKVYLGPARNFYANLGVGVFQVETGTLQSGDRIMVTGPSTGVVTTTAAELRVDDRVVPEVGKGDLFSTAVPEKIRRSDKLYKLIPA
ncbi:U32 family peptidase [Balneolales bacterium ANBcel1]|nr:U32 family peptidase [Balneolales bacterium ANBcel1]